MKQRAHKMEKRVPHRVLIVRAKLIVNYDCGSAVSKRNYPVQKRRGKTQTRPSCITLQKVHHLEYEPMRTIWPDGLTWKFYEARERYTIESKARPRVMLRHLKIMNFDNEGTQMQWLRGNEPLLPD